MCNRPKIGALVVYAGKQAEVMATWVNNNVWWVVGRFCGVKPDFYDADGLQSHFVVPVDQVASA